MFKTRVPRVKHNARNCLKYFLNLFTLFTLGIIILTLFKEKGILLKIEIRR